MQKLLLVDAGNLMHRSAYIHTDLSFDNEPTGAMFGFFKSIVMARRDFPLYHLVICYDGGHKRRDIESKQGVIAGIIPEAYKENRGKNQSDQNKLVRWQIDRQWPVLQEGLEFTACQQVRIPDYEADDIIASLVLGCSNPSVIVSSDKDFYQLLEPDVSLYDPIRESTMELASYQEKYGLTAPMQWVDCCALSGDAGDNIFGVPGVGEVTALALVKEHKSLDNVIKFLSEQKASGGKIPKRQLTILDHIPRVKLAYSLKQMDCSIPGIPEISPHTGNAEKLLEFFKKHGFESLYDKVELLM